MLNFEFNISLCADKLNVSVLFQTGRLTVKQHKTSESEAFINKKKWKNK